MKDHQLLSPHGISCLQTHEVDPSRDRLSTIPAPIPVYLTAANAESLINKSCHTSPTNVENVQDDPPYRLVGNRETDVHAPS